MAHQHSAGFLKIVQDAKSRVRELTVDQVKAKLDRREKFTLVDVREDNEWARGHLPGAVHLGKGIIERDIEEAFPDKDAALVLYCGGGFRCSSAAAPVDWARPGGGRIALALTQRPASGHISAA